MKLLRSLPSALPSASAIGHRMGSALGALPRPSVDLHLAAQALRSVKRGVRSAARGVAGVFVVAPQPAPTTMQSLRALSSLGRAAPQIPGLAPALTIPDAQELADNLSNSGDVKLAVLGQSIDRVVRQASQLEAALDALVAQRRMPADDAPTLAAQVTKLRAAALATQTNAMETCFGFSTHLQQWMNQLVELSTVTQARVTAGATLVSFNETPQADAADIDDHSKVSSTRTAQTPSDAPLGSPSEPGSPLDFSAINQYVTAENSELMDSFVLAFNRQISILNAARSEQDNQPVGATAWCVALRNEVQSLTEIHDLLGVIANKYRADHDTKFVRWLDHKKAGVATEILETWNRIDEHADALRQAGFRL